jgi:hypothetical protein
MLEVIARSNSTYINKGSAIAVKVLAVLNIPGFRFCVCQYTLGWGEHSEVNEVATDRLSNQAFSQCTCILVRYEAWLRPDSYIEGHMEVVRAQY